MECTDLLDPGYEPRIQRPIPPPDLSGESMSELQKAQIMEDWTRTFLLDVKGCGEALQRHVCLPVCHKYGNEGKCRFLFPHDVVEASHFDAESNSIMLSVRDPTVNYYNPYILVFCRHNHDLKCILSGKSAKAAMMYITDYITKMDLKTYQILAMLSKAIIGLGADGEGEVNVRDLLLNDTKRLLHKCLSQFAKQREIHAQQAVRLIRGFEGSWESHESTVMLSRSLISHVKRTYAIREKTRPDDLEAEECDEDEDGQAVEEVRIDTDDSGTLIRTNQVWDYFLRDQRLNEVCFYEFAQRYKLVKKKGRRRETSTDPRSTPRFQLKASHQLSDTHELQEIKRGSRDGLIPRVYGCAVPRQSNAFEYWVFCLAHFKPFGNDDPLFCERPDVEHEFHTFSFSARATEIMDNWNALYESEDARDAERTKKKNAALKESRLLSELARAGCPVGDTLNTLDCSTGTSISNDLECQELATVLGASGWFTGDTGAELHINTERDKIQFTAVSGAQMRRWRLEMKHAENAVKRSRRKVDVPGSVVGPTIRETMSGDGVASPASNTPTDFIRPSVNTSDVTENTADEIELIKIKNGLNKEQSMAYDVIVRRFLDLIAHVHDRPLRLFLTGPGGTGKTHVVNCVKQVMDLHGKGHCIRFLAPTGTAAALINGTTVHQGLGISIKNNSDKGSDSSNLNVRFSIKNRNELREEWKDVDVVLIDEVSMVSLALLGEIDHALRYVKEKSDEWFGGVMMIFSGDFYQYPPVGGAALYSGIRPRKNVSDSELRNRLGAMAWNSLTDVVELTEQQRMKGDQEYAGAVLRLRKRCCTVADAVLFNSRLIKSAENPGGVDLSSPVAMKGSQLSQLTINGRLLIF